MAKDNRKEPGKPAGIMVRVEYVGVVAVACLLIGAITGYQMSQGSKTITVDTHNHGHEQQTQAAAPPSEEEINHLISMIGTTSNYEALVHMGNQAMDQHITAVAIAAYEKALKIRPDDPNVLTDLGAVYNDQMKNPRKALELFKRAAALDSKHIQSRYNMGIAYALLKDTKSALKAYEEVIALAPASEHAKHARIQIEKLENEK